jgi:hypothetical protein
MFQYVDAIRLLMAWCELRWGLDPSGFNGITGFFKEDVCPAKSRLPTHAPHLAAGN